MSMLFGILSTTITHALRQFDPFHYLLSAIKNYDGEAQLVPPIIARLPDYEEDGGIGKKTLITVPAIAED